MRLLYFVMCVIILATFAVVSQRLVNQWWEPDMACMIREVDGCCSMLL